MFRTEKRERNRGTRQPRGMRKCLNWRSTHRLPRRGFHFHGNDGDVVDGDRVRAPTTNKQPSKRNGVHSKGLRGSVCVFVGCAHSHRVQDVECLIKSYRRNDKMPLKSTYLRRWCNWECQNQCAVCARPNDQSMVLLNLHDVQQMEMETDLPLHCALSTSFIAGDNRRNAHGTLYGR